MIKLILREKNNHNRLLLKKLLVIKLALAFKKSIWNTLFFISKQILRFSTVILVNVKIKNRLCSCFFKKTNQLLFLKDPLLIF